MEPTVILVNVEYGQIIAAEVRDKRLQHVEIELQHAQNGSESTVGNIYKGLVEDVVRALNAAFVNIGTGKNAFLPLDDVSQKLHGRDPLLVQIEKEPIEDKGARLTKNISIPGRFLVLTDQAASIGVSQKIKPRHQAERLRELAREICPEGRGLIVRTEAQNATEDQIRADAAALDSQMTRIRQEFANQREPGRLHSNDDLMTRLIRDRLTEQVQRLVVDDAHAFARLQELARQWAPELAPRIELDDESPWIFERFGVHRDFAQVQERAVGLPSGGTIYIDETDTLTVVDVNTARNVGRKQKSLTVLQTNLEAAQEIARQLRIRNIGGVVVIDFVDLDIERDRAQVLQTLSDALKEDRARTKVVHASPSGLVEISRQRLGASLKRNLKSPCSCCQGSGFVSSIASEAVGFARDVRTFAKRHPSTKAIVATLPLDVAAALLAVEAKALIQLERRTACEIHLLVNEPPKQHSFESRAVHIMTPVKERPSPAVGERFTILSNQVRDTSLGAVCVRNEMLVRLLGVPKKRTENQQLVVEIAESNRWNCSGRVLAVGDIKS